jgi:hypothetical protein
VTAAKLSKPCSELNRLGPNERFEALGGKIGYHELFESFTGREIDPKKNIAGPYRLQNDRGVFDGQASALNGLWNFLIKLRYVAGNWEWRSAIYDYARNNAPHAILSDTDSSGFPESKRRRPVLPITRDDCIAESDADHSRAR